jgi:putative transposase
MGLLIDFHQANITGTEVRVFLGAMLRHLRGHIVLLWDGGPIHKRREVQDFIRRHPRLQAYRFPAYAPELNPDELVWTNAKRDLSNGVPKNIQELNRQLRKSIRTIRCSQQKLRSCIYASDLPWPR